MDAFTQLRELVLPLDRANVDTDAIIPKQYLKSIKRSGFGPTLFDEWRYRDHGEPGLDHSARPLNSNFALNLPCANFGYGSSREHAPTARPSHSTSSPAANTR